MVVNMVVVNEVDVSASDTLNESKTNKLAHAIVIVRQHIIESASLKYSLSTSLICPSKLSLINICFGITVAYQYQKNDVLSISWQLHTA